MGKFALRLGVTIFAFTVAATVPRIASGELAKGDLKPPAR